MPHSFPLGLAMPSLLRMRVISRVPLPASARSKMRRTMRDVSGLISRVGRFLGPSGTMIRLYPKGAWLETQKPREAASRIPRKTSVARFSL